MAKSNEARYVANTTVLLDIAMSARVELVAAARNAWNEMDDTIDEAARWAPGREDWKDLRAAKDRLLDALEPFSEVEV